MQEAKSQTQYPMQWKPSVLHMAKMLDQCIASNGEGVDFISVNDFNLVPQRAGWFVLKLDINAMHPPPSSTSWGLRNAPLEPYSERPDCVIHRLRLEGRLECRRVCLTTNSTWCMAFVQNATGIDLDALDDIAPPPSNNACFIRDGSEMEAPASVFEMYMQQQVGVDAQGRLGFYNAERWEQAFPSAVSANAIDSAQLHVMHMTAIQEIAVLLRNALNEIHKLQQRLK